MQLFTGLREAIMMIVAPVAVAHTAHFKFRQLSMLRIPGDTSQPPGHSRPDREKMAKIRAWP